MAKDWLLTRADHMTYLGHVSEMRIPEWTLGDRMRKARIEAGLQQSELAAEIGIGRTSVVQYEADRKKPSRPVLLSWALRCGVNLDWLIRGVVGVYAGQRDVRNQWFSRQGKGVGRAA